jgi:undecaprenyl-diphosphatase
VFTAWTSATFTGTFTGTRRSLLPVHLIAASGSQSTIPPLHITNLQAIILGLLQGVTELFPISSLGHTVLYPSLFGWHALVVSQSQPESHWLGFVVMLHVGSALGILVFFWRDWVLIIRAWWRTLVRRRVETPTEKLSWLIVISSIPAGLLGLAFEHQLRVLLAKPALAAIFLMVNGLVLFGGELARRRVLARGPRQVQGPIQLPGLMATAAAGPPVTGPPVTGPPVTGPTVTGAPDVPAPSGGGAADAGPTGRDARRVVGSEHEPAGRTAVAAQADDSQSMAELTYPDALVIGIAQSSALIAGISRDGVCMTAGLARGLSHETAARFAFLLATPVILAAGLFKLPDFLGAPGAGIRVPALLGLVFAALGALVSVRWLVRWFRTGTLVPFAIYCLVFGLAMTIYFSAA